jgi:tripartite-type tricarboxylate transporter receptor subunit TctC
MHPGIVPVAAIAVSFAIVGGASAQAWPAKTVRVIVPYAAGGGADFVARVYARTLGEALGQQFVVDNRGGANGNIGAEMAAKSPPDGYTLLLSASSNLTVNPSIYRKMPFDALKDFAPVSQAATQPTILVIHPALPATTLKDFVALARSRPAQLNFGSAGTGSSAHLAAELFKVVAKVDMVHVPYKGTGPATADLLAGQIPLMFNNLPPSMPLIRAGRLRALAVTSLARSPAAPDVPTMAENGYPDVEVSVWNAFLAPAGTPAAIVQRLNAEIVKAARGPEVKDRLAAEGTEAVAGTPEQLTALLRTDTAKWAKVVRIANIPVE